MSYHLSEHFTLDEFLQSSTANSRKINNMPATPAELASVLDNLTHLANTLEVLRSKLGRALRVTSGYRCPALNTAVGGVATSRHKLGCAADIATSDIDQFVKVARTVRGITTIIPYRDRHFVHVEAVRN